MGVEFDHVIVGIPFGREVRGASNGSLLHLDRRDAGAFWIKVLGFPTRKRLEGSPVAVVEVVYTILEIAIDDKFITKTTGLVAAAQDIIAVPAFQQITPGSAE